MRHGMSRTAFYRRWASVYKRCFCPNGPWFHRYGGRGITTDWRLFLDFKDDMYESYLQHVEKYGEENTTIERIDNDKNYTKDNCCWTTWKKQARNTSRNKTLTFNGETKCVSEWAEELGVNTQTLFSRLRRGWSLDKALKKYDYRTRQRTIKRDT